MARTANRQREEHGLPQNRVWYVGFYIRLSREDKRGKEESESITNQRLILTDFLEQQEDGDDYIYVDEYVDEGVSGTTDEERENFQRLLTDIQKGTINCVIVKNLARSFRNGGDQSYYLGDWFPRNNVRFISLYQQPIDTYKDPQNAQNIAVPVQGVLNEEHARGTSESIRRTFDKKREKGLHIGSFAVYGYQKSLDDKNALIIDEEAAAHVQRIFHWYIEGLSKHAIAQRLNERGVLCPSAYKRRKGLNYKNPNAVVGTPLWCAVSVGNILKNRMYVGDMVQGRYRIKSYKIHLQERVPEAQWYVVENTHAAIIPREEFKTVQTLLLQDTRTAPNQKHIYPFSGLLHCADCGKAMTRSKVGKHIYYYCRTYKDQSKMACTKHAIKHTQLEESIKCAIQQQLYLGVEFAHLQAVLKAAPMQETAVQKLEAYIVAKEKELAKILYYKQSTYEDWKDGHLNQEEYCHMHREYENKAEQLIKVLEHLRGEKTRLQEKYKTKTPLLVEAKEYLNISQLTREILAELIEDIQVYENGTILVKFKFTNVFTRKS